MPVMTQITHDKIVPSFTHSESPHAPTDAEANALNTVVDPNYVATEESYTTIEKNKLTDIEELADVTSINETSHANVVSNNVANTFTEPQRTTVEVGLNALALTDMQKLSFTATVANITVASQSGGQSGTIRIFSSENITGWGTEFFWGTQGEPVGLTGTAVFSYEVFDDSGVESIAMGLL